MTKVIEAKLDAQGLKFAIISSRFNDFITAKLTDGALDALIRHNAKKEDISLIKVPGAFEIPLTAKLTAQSGNYDVVICLGALIQGSTDHYQYIASEVVKGIASVSLESEVPVIFGVLTTNTLEQAVERAGTKSGNEGFEAAVTAIEMANLKKIIP